MLEDLIRGVLVDGITLPLAQYNGQNAVFYQQFPHDNDKGWGDAVQYPRVEYDTDWTFNPERNAAGRLKVSVYCLNENPLPPEDFGAEIKELLSALFLTQEGCTNALLWSRTDAFSVKGNQTQGKQNEPRIDGVDVVFDILAFPLQRSTKPDPVISTMTYIEEYFSGIEMIGSSALPEAWKATDENPAVYVRLITNQMLEVWNSVSWMMATLVIHVISPSTDTRAQWLKGMVDKIAVDARIWMDDGSPMLIQGLSYDTTRNPLSEGQITLKGRYGVISVAQEGEPLTNIHHTSFNHNF